MYHTQYTVNTRTGQGQLLFGGLSHVANPVLFGNVLAWQPDCARQPNGINHVPGQCTRFYQCWNGNPVGGIRNCGPGTAFDGNVCNWPDQANCDASWRQLATTTPKPTTETTTTTTRSTTAPKAKTKKELTQQILRLRHLRKVHHF